jgi:hypothetical protein
MTKDQSNRRENSTELVGSPIAVLMILTASTSESRSDKRKPIVVTNAVPSRRPSHGLRTRAVLVDGEWIVRTPLGVDADHCRRPAED